MPAALPALSDLQSYVSDATSPADNVELSASLAAAKPWMAQHCKRTFVVAGTATQRRYVPTTDDVVRIHDCTTITLVTNAGVTVAPSAYQTEPLNNIDLAGVARPIEQIRLINGSSWTFGSSNSKEATVLVTATWGWPTIPDDVFQACLILAADICSNRDKRNGIVSFTDFAGIRARENPQVLTLLAAYRRAERHGIA